MLQILIAICFASFAWAAPKHAAPGGTLEGVSLCPPFQPGTKVTPKRNGELSKKYYEAFDKYFSSLDGVILNAQQKQKQKEVGRMDMLWQDELEKETLPALAALFSNPETTISYAAFDPPTKDLEKVGEDGASGFRVVFQKEWEFPPGQKKLVSAMTFWQYNSKTKKMELMAGPDALRIRVQIGEQKSIAEDQRGAPISAPYESPAYEDGFIGLSYTLAQKEGKITSLVPTPNNETKEVPDENEHHATKLSDCMMCHAGKKTLVDSHQVKDATFPFVDNAHWTKFADHYAKSSKPTRDNLEKLLKNPRTTFALPNLLSSVSERCRQLTP